MATYRSGAVLEALADPTRRSLFELLGRGPRSVAELAADVPISRPAVSQHLKVLHDARLVTVRPMGTRRIYSLDRRGLAEIRAYFDQFWRDALDDFAVEVERSKEEDR